ncbi:MAG: hypothetical protein ACKO2G_07745 [Verrucomicrobiales bacterium]
MTSAVEPNPARRRPTFIQVALMVLPIGTVVLGTIAMLWYFHEGSRPGAKEERGLYTKEPTAASIRDSVRKLSLPPLAVRGEATEAGGVGWQATMSLIEGATGETNMGYQPVLHEYDSGAGKWRHLWVDNSGKRNLTEIIEVRARSVPTGNREGLAVHLPIAVALELAQAFAGTENRRTIRFVFLGGGQDPTGEQSYAELMKDRRIKVQGVFDLDASDFRAAACLDASGQIDDTALMREVENLRQNIRRAANQ